MIQPSKISVNGSYKYIFKKVHTTYEPKGGESDWSCKMVKIKFCIWWKW